MFSQRRRFTLWFAMLGRGAVWCVITSVSKYIPLPSSRKSHPVLCVLFRIPFRTSINISSKKDEEKCVELNGRTHFGVSDKGLFVDFFSSSSPSMHKTYHVPLSCEILQFATVYCVWRIANCTCRPQQGHLSATTGTLQPCCYVCDVTFVSLSSGNPQLPLGDANHPAHEHVAGMPTFLSKISSWRSRLPLCDERPEISDVIGVSV
jgi:hypothetical protein